MAIPDYQSIMLPLLKLAHDDQEHKFSESVELLGAEFKLTEDELNEWFPNGKNKIFHNRVGWALLYLVPVRNWLFSPGSSLDVKNNPRNIIYMPVVIFCVRLDPGKNPSIPDRHYLKRAGLLEPTRRGYYMITERGKSVLSESPEKIDNKYLEKFKEFVEFKTSGKQPSNDVDATKKEQVVDSEQTPEESLEYAYQAIRQSLATDLLDQVKDCTPSFFERLVIELLVNMGYGGSRKDAGQAIGKSGDEGIDGIIKEDRLGLDVIYIQAKKWENPVSRPEIQKFAGALQGFRAKKGIFITTSSFSTHANDFVNKVDSRIILIDGQQLAQLMIDFNIGVATKDIYEIKKIDIDYFEN